MKIGQLFQKLKEGGKGQNGDPKKEQ